VDRVTSLKTDRLRCTIIASSHKKHLQSFVSRARKTLTLISPPSNYDWDVVLEMRNLAVVFVDANRPVDADIDCEEKRDNPEQGPFRAGNE
jgi:hypothetical protein